MANPLKVLTALSASYGAAVSGSSGLKIEQGGVTVESGGATVSAGGLTVSAGTTAVQALTATTISGSSTLEVGGAATFGGAVTVNGNLTVAGTTTTVNSTNLLITDKKVVFASGSSNASEANTAGIYLGNEASAVASLQYVSSALGATGHAWTSSENMNLAASKTYKLDGIDVLSRTAGTNIFSNSTTGQIQLSVGGTTSVSGSVLTRLQGPLVQLSGVLGTQVSNDFSVLGQTTLVGASATFLTASSGVSASVFVLADGTQLTSSTQLGGAAGDATKAGVESAYNAVRFVTSSVLDGNGFVEVDLTTAGDATKFATANLNKISVDVLTRPSGDSNYWNNDLVSVKLENSASSLWVKIDAPASPGASYRLVAINESDFDVV